MYVQWISDVLPKNTINYAPEIFTDGSYSNTPSIESVFRPELTKTRATVSIIFKDSSCDWKSKTIYVIHIHSGTDLKVTSAYTMEFLALGYRNLQFTPG